MRADSVLAGTCGFCPPCKSYPPTWQKKIWRFIPKPHWRHRDCPASMSRATIFSATPGMNQKHSTGRRSDGRREGGGPVIRRGGSSEWRH